jgi:hypothetical protein
MYSSIDASPPIPRPSTSNAISPVRIHKMMNNKKSLIKRRKENV